MDRGPWIPSKASPPFGKPRFEYVQRPYADVIFPCLLKHTKTRFIDTSTRVPRVPQVGQHHKCLTDHMEDIRIYGTVCRLNCAHVYLGSLWQGLSAYSDASYMDFEAVWESSQPDLKILEWPSANKAHLLICFLSAKNSLNAGRSWGPGRGQCNYTNNRHLKICISVYKYSIISVYVLPLPFSENRSAAAKISKLEQFNSCYRIHWKFAKRFEQFIHRESCNLI